MELVNMNIRIFEPTAPSYRFLFEKLIIAYLVKELQLFMEPQILLQYSLSCILCQLNPIHTLTFFL
jgi:hypothetical protein